MTRGAAVASGDAAISEAASAALEAGGGSVDAVVAAFVMAAAIDPAVLFAPAVALVSGMGVGGRAFDGRAAQPGQGGQRPRGFVDDVVPDGARVAAPRTVPMLALLHGYRSRLRLAALTAPAAARAARDGATARAELLRQVGDGGAMAMHRAGVTRALVAAGGPVAGGALTAEDLTEARPDTAEATPTPAGEGALVYGVPWPAGSEAARAGVILAADVQGVVAALAYVTTRDVVPIPELGLEIGKHAAPVRRGVTRAPPGTPIACPAPIAVLARGGGFHAALGAPGRTELTPADLTGVVAAFSLDDALAALGALAAIWDGRAARLGYKVTP